MEKQQIKSKVMFSLFWKLMERGGTQGIQFIVQIVLARLLLPEEYGIIALLSIFISFANLFVQSGFNTALIQKKDADKVDFSSVFYLSLFIAGLLYVILFITAQFIADFFREPQLVLLLRILSCTLFFGALNSIQNAYLAKNMMFKKLFFSSLGAIVVSGAIGVITAYSGWGVWALVAQQLVNQFVITIILWFTIKWRPSFLFSFKRVRVLFSFGWKLLVSAVLCTLDRNIRTLIIGKNYSSDILGFYNRGQQFPEIIGANIDGSIQSVLFPAFASHQDNLKKVKNMMRRAIMTSSFIMFPMMVGLAVVAEPLVKLLLTDKWIPAVPFFQISCAAEALIPIQTTNLQAINALGRSDIFLKLEIVKTIIGLIILGISIPFGIYAMAWGVFLSCVISTFINAYPNFKLLNYSYIEQWKDIMPTLVIALVMGAVIYPLSFLTIAVWQILLIQIVVGAIVYFSLAMIFKIESFSYLIATIKEIISG